MEVESLKGIHSIDLMECAHGHTTSPHMYDLRRRSYADNVGPYNCMSPPSGKETNITSLVQGSLIQNKAAIDGP